MRIGVWLKLGRVSNLPTVWSNVLAAAALSGGLLEAAQLGLLALALSSAYVGGMYLNDAFDRKIDGRERPTRPIPAGLVSARTVFTIGFALLLAAAGLAGYAGIQRDPAYGPKTLASALALSGAVITYDMYHKGNPLSPVLMALCRVLVYFTVSLALTGTLPAAVLWGSGGLCCHLIGLTYAAKQENLAEPRGAWPLVLLAAAPAAGLLTSSTGLAQLLWLACGVWSAYAVSFFLRRADRSIPGAVVRLIAGISGLDAALCASAAAANGDSWRLVLPCLLCWVLTRAAQRYVPGT